MTVFKRLLWIICLVGCSQQAIKPTIPIYETGVCWVKWSDPENKRKFEAGRGHSRAYLAKYDLLIPLWTNGGIEIKSFDQKFYGIKFDPSDPQAKILVTELMDNYFVYVPEKEWDMRTRLSAMVFKVSPERLHQLLVGYEAVDCTQWLWSQVL